MKDPLLAHKYCHDGWPGITDQPWYKPLNTPEELKKANEEYALEHRPISPEKHNKESRKIYNLPPCTCGSCNMGPENPHLESPENYL